MLAAVVEGPGQLIVRSAPVSRVEGGALVRVARAGVCGTDRDLAAGTLPVIPPRVLGHEMTGWVESPAPGGAVAAGTRVVVNPAVFCGACRQCRAGRLNLCPRGGLLGRDVDGCFAECVMVSEASLHPLPDSVGVDEAALLQVLSTCVHAQDGVPVSPDARAVVIGVGVTGLLHLQLLRARGVREIVAVTSTAWKRDLALACGASAVTSLAEAAATVAEVTGGQGADLVIECAGTSDTLVQAVRLAGRGATVLGFGVVTAVDGLPAYDAYLKELTLRWPRASLPGDFDTAIRLCAEHRLELAPLITGRFPLTEAAAALTASGMPGHLKVLLEVADPP